MSGKPNHRRGHGRIKDGGCVAGCPMCNPRRNVPGTTVHEPRQEQIARLDEREQVAEEVEP